MVDLGADEEVVHVKEEVHGWESSEWGEDVMVGAMKEEGVRGEGG